MRRTECVVLFLLALLLLSMPLAPNPAVLAQDCGDAENGEGCSSPGEYDVPSEFLPQINGADWPGRPGDYSYSVTGGCPPYTWMVIPNESKSIISIDQNGKLQLSANSCGAYTVKVTDQCGHESSFDGKVNYNNSRWVLIESCEDPGFVYPHYDEHNVNEGNYSYHIIVASDPAYSAPSGCAGVCTAAQTYCSGVSLRCGVAVYEWKCQH